MLDYKDPEATMEPSEVLHSLSSNHLSQPQEEDPLTNLTNPHCARCGCRWAGVMKSTRSPAWIMRP